MLYSDLGNISNFLSCANQIEHFSKNIGCQIIFISRKFMQLRVMPIFSDVGIFKS